MIRTIIQFGCVLAASAMLGHWYLSESRKLKAMGKPWYAIYFKAPGILLICIVVLLPLLLKSLLASGLG